MKRRTITLSLKREAVQAYRSGESVADIARRLRVERSLVEKIVTKIDSLSGDRKWKRE